MRNGIHVRTYTDYTHVRKEMECFRKESCVRGYHIYRELWEAAIGEDLACQRECGNVTDAYAARTAALYWTTLRAFSQYLLHLFVRFRDRLRSETATL